MFTREIWTFERKLRWLWVVADSDNFDREERKKLDQAKFDAISPVYDGEVHYGLIPVLSPSMDKQETRAYVERHLAIASVESTEIYNGEEKTPIYER